MASAINKFQTISRHSGPLATSPNIITCLVEILKYIDTRLGDEASNDLLVLITNHLTAVSSPYPHYVNMHPLDSQIIDIICDDMINSGNYIGTREDFLTWLLSSVEIYEGTIPENPDMFTRGISLGIAIIVLEEHNVLTDIHDNSLKEDIEHLMVPVPSTPNFSIGPSLFEFSNFATLSDDTHEILEDRTTDALIANPPAYPTVNFLSNDDLAKDISSQFAANFIGRAGISHPFQLDYGETSQPVYNKDIDYYANHLDYALSTSMNPLYENTITALRDNVNGYYHKVYDLYTRIDRDHLTISTEITVSMTTNKTLDILNLIGLSKSLCCITLEPSTTPGLNNLVVRFDNFNPAFSTILLEDFDDETNEIKVILILTKTEFIVFFSIGNFYDKIVFDNSAKMFNEPARYLFVPPKVKHARRGTLRLNYIETYNKVINDDEAIHIISGYNPHERR